MPENGSPRKIGIGPRKLGFKSVAAICAQGSIKYLKSWTGYKGQHAQFTPRDLPALESTSAAIRPIRSVVRPAPGWYRTRTPLSVRTAESGLISAGLFGLFRGREHTSQLKYDFAMIGTSKLRRVRIFFP